MKATTMISLMIKLALAIALTIVSTTILFAQEKSEYGGKVRDFCSDTDSDRGGRAAVRDLRELTAQAGPINVDAGRNGGIRVRAKTARTFWCVPAFKLGARISRPRGRLRSP